jgi:hypothetical protein
VRARFVQEIAPARISLGEGQPRQGSEFLSVDCVALAESQTVGAIDGLDDAALGARQVQDLPHPGDGDLKAAARAGCREVRPQRLEDHVFGHRLVTVDRQEAHQPGIDRPGPSCIRDLPAGPRHSKAAEQLESQRRSGASQPLLGRQRR